MKKRWHLSRRFLILTLIATALALGYLHFGLLPGKSKNLLIQAIQTHTPYQVSFNKVLYLPFRGLTFEDFNAKDKEGALLIAAKSLSINLKILPFFQEKKIIVSNLYFDSLEYDLKFHPKHKNQEGSKVPLTKLSGKFPIPRIENDEKINLTTLEKGPDMLLPENVYLEQVQIVNGHIRIKKAGSNALIEEIRSLNLKMGFQAPPLLNLEGSFFLGTKRYNHVSFEGHWSLKDNGYEFETQMKGGEIPAWLIQYQKKNFFTLKDGEFKITSRIQNLPDKKVSLRSQAYFKNANIAFSQLDTSGEIFLETETTFDLENRSFHNYKGKLELVDVSIRNLTPKIPEINHIQGSILFKPDTLNLKSIQGRHQDIPFEVNGTIDSFQNLTIDAMIKTESSLEKVLSLLPAEYQKMSQKFTITGFLEALTHVTGSLRKSPPLLIDHKIAIQNGSIKSLENPIELKDFSSDLHIDDEGFQVENTRFRLYDQIYNLDGFIPKDATAGTLNLSSKNLQFSASYTLDNTLVWIQEARASYQGIQTTFSGNLKNLTSPFLDIKGNASIQLEETLQEFSKHWPVLQKIKLEGKLEGIYVLKGKWNNPQRWNFKMDAQSEHLLVHQKLHVPAVDLQIRMQDGLLKIPYLKALPYAGTLQLTSSLNLTTANIHFDSKASGRNIDLETLIQDLEIEHKDIQGKATLQTSLSGLLGDPSSFKGEGIAQVRHGKLWQTAKFKDMGRLPFVKVIGLDRVTFKDLTASFTIADQKIQTQDLTIYGDTVQLLIQGHAGFDKALDFLMKIRYSEQIMEGALDSGGLIPFVVQEAEDFISDYKIIGTLDKPQFEKQPLPMGQIINKKLSTLFSARN